MKTERIEITVQRPLGGGLLLTTMYRGNYYKHRYFDYKLPEAMALFREYVKDEDSKIFRNIPVEGAK